MRRREAGTAPSRFTARGAAIAGSRIAALGGSLSSLVLSRTGISATALAAAVAVSLGVLCVVESRAGRRSGTWVAYVLGFVLFAHLRTLADDVGLPVRFDYPADADEALFATVPGAWLQAHVDASGATSALDVYAAAVYVSYFLVPHAVAIALWRRNGGLFRRYAVAVLLTVYAGLLVSFAVPTAPPWLAAEVAGGAETARVLADVLGWEPESYGASAPGVNPVAAMPSLHMALTVLVAAALWRVRAARLPAAAYGASMAFALVYTGEHYVSDVLAGVAVAAAAWALAPVALRARPYAESARATASPGS